MIKKHFYSFQNAILGLKWAYKTQANFRIHLFLASISLLAGLILNISYGEFLIIFTLIGVGLAIELVNTAIEEAIDAIHKDWSEEIKIAKDVSAAAMLIFSAGALLIACIIFLPKIINLFKF